MSTSVRATAAFLATAAGHPTIAAEKRRGFEALALAAGSRVLDVGCGIGADLDVLARHVRTGGQVHGVDTDPSMLDAARCRAVAASAAVHVVGASARRLPYPSASFDAVRVDRVLQHVSRAEDAVAEAYRVLRPGGVVYLADTDWSTLTISCLPRELLERLRAYLLQAAVARPTIGAELARMLVDCGVGDLDVRGFAVVSRQRPPATGQLPAARASGYLSEAQEREIMRLTAHAEASGVLVAAVTMFAVTARKP